MIESFSNYLKRTNTHDQALCSPDVMRSRLEDWSEELTASLRALRKSFPPRFIQTFLAQYDREIEKIFGDKLLSQLQPFTRQDKDADEKIGLIDQYYLGLINSLNTIFSRQFLKTPMVKPRGFYPFEKAHSGVGLIFRLVNEAGQVIHGTEINVQSLVGMKGKEKKTLLDNLRKSVNKTDSLNTALRTAELEAGKEVGKYDHAKMIKFDRPHAEDFLFAYNFERMMEHIQNLHNSLSEDYQPPYDELWLTHLNGPRVEFVQTSSICGDCQPYFNALRQAMKAARISLPIVMFAKSPYNTDEPKFPIAYIDSSGQYQCPGVSWQLQFGNLKQLRAVKKNQELEHYVHFEQYGRALLPILITNKTLAICYWKELISFAGSGAYFLWLCEFTIRLFSAFDERPAKDQPPFAEMVVPEQLFTNVAADVRAFIQSEYFEEFYRSTVKEVVTEDAAYWQFLIGITRGESGKDLSFLEYAYWKFFLIVARYGKVVMQVGDDCVVFTVNDMVDKESFYCKYLGKDIPPWLDEYLKSQENIGEKKADSTSVPTSEATLTKLLKFKATYASMLKGQQQLKNHLGIKISDYDIIQQYVNIQDGGTREDQQKEELFQLTSDLVYLYYQIIKLEFELSHEPVGPIDEYIATVGNQEIAFEEREVDGDGWCMLNAIDVSNPKEKLLSLINKLDTPQVQHHIVRAFENNLYTSVVLGEEFAIKGNDSDGNNIQQHLVELYIKLQTFTNNTPKHQEAYLKWLNYLSRKEVLTAYIKYLCQSKYVDENVAAACLIPSKGKIASFHNYLNNGQLVANFPETINPLSPDVVCVIFHPGNVQSVAHYNLLKVKHHKAPGIKRLSDELSKLSHRTSDKEVSDKLDDAEHESPGELDEAKLSDEINSLKI